MIIEKRKTPAFHCPHWEELPDMDLYMDQVATLLNEHLKPFHARDQEKIVTSIMVNNYVKYGIVSPSIKKEHMKNHVAYLMVVCILKMVYRMDEISKLIHVQIYEYPIDQAYNYFYAELEYCLERIFTHKKVYHTPSDDEESLMIDLIRNTVQTVTYAIYVRRKLEYPQIIIQEESDTQAAFTVICGSSFLFCLFPSINRIQYSKRGTK